MVGRQGASALVCAAVAAAVATAGVAGKTVFPGEDTSLFSNPGIGYQTFHGAGCNNQYMGTDPNVNDLPKSRALYYRLPWERIETSPNNYDWSVLDAALNAAIACDQKFAFRIYAGDAQYGGPSNLGLPGTSVFDTDGQGPFFMPDLDDATVQQRMANLIAAAGARYDNNGHLDYVDVGMVGYWGEWHTSGTSLPMPSVASATAIVNMHISAFPNTPLVILGSAIDDRSWAHSPAHVRPAAETALAAGAGWRVDCWGAWNRPNNGGIWGFMETEYPYQIDQQPTMANAWVNGPVSLEPCGIMSGWVSEGYPQDDTWLWTLQHHASSFHNKNTRIPSSYIASNTFQNLLYSIGYKLRMDTVTYADAVAPGGTLSVTVDLTNLNVAPPYAPQWRAAVALLNSNNQVVGSVATGEQVTGWTPGSHTTCVTVTVPSTPGTYKVAFGIWNTVLNKAEIRLANSGGVQGDTWFPAGTVSVANGASVGAACGGTAPPPPATTGTTGLASTTGTQRCYRPAPPPPGCPSTTTSGSADLDSDWASWARRAAAAGGRGWSGGDDDGDAERRQSNIDIFNGGSYQGGFSGATYNAGSTSLQGGVVRVDFTGGVPWGVFILSGGSTFSAAGLTELRFRIRSVGGSNTASVGIFATNSADERFNPVPQDIETNYVVGGSITDTFTQVTVPLSSIGVSGSVQVKDIVFHDIAGGSGGAQVFELDDIVVGPAAPVTGSSSSGGTGPPPPPPTSSSSSSTTGMPSAPPPMCPPPPPPIEVPCQTQCEPAQSNCNQPRAEPGCECSCVQSCVCARDGYCCAVEWDSLCVQEISSFGCDTASCPFTPRTLNFAATRLDDADTPTEFACDYEGAARADSACAAIALDRDELSEDAYTCCDRHGTTGADDAPAYAFEDLGGIGAVVLGLGDNVMSAPVSIGFQTRLYGDAATVVYVSSNGFLSAFPNQPAGAGNRGNTAGPIPSLLPPNAIIAPLFTDLRVSSPGEVLAATRGVAGNQRFIVQWRNLPSGDATNPTADTVDFQMKIFEATDHIEFHYRSVSGAGANATVGIEDRNGVEGIGYAAGNLGAAGVGNGLVRNGDAIAFCPPGMSCFVDTVSAAGPSTAIASPAAFVAAVFAAIVVLAVV